MHTIRKGEADVTAMLTQQQRADAARRSILDATIRVLANEGYRRATFTRIQDVAGMSRGLIGYHFGNKQALIEAVVQALRDNYHDETAAATAQAATGREELETLVETYLSRLGDDSGPAQVMLVLGVESINEHPGMRDAVRAAYAALRADIVRMVERGLGDGSIVDEQEPKAIAGLVEAVLRGTVLQYLVDADAFDLVAARRAAMAVVRCLAQPSTT
ncbi:TetR/AcrR family transcriptional regulator [Cumulibacter manganitolerans]|uniref:TetR/AcrR family transcriptional regulator n=1 Tax=Cumulibacter manganitolerans TaxID=1884992 RepID=UPI0018863AD5|nr:TetR/AcrR family transcriptional regulator [Cumulibacter manganitolerans]